MLPLKKKNTKVKQTPVLRQFITVLMIYAIIYRFVSAKAGLQRLFQAPSPRLSQPVCSAAAGGGLGLALPQVLMVSFPREWRKSKTELSINMNLTD